VRDNSEDGPGCLRFLVAPFILGWLVFVAFAAMSAGSLSATLPLANGATGLLLISFVGVWKLVQRWPTMRPPLAFVAGAVVALLAAGEMLLQMEVRHIRSSVAAMCMLVVTVVALWAMLWLWRWAWRRSHALEAAARQRLPGHPRGDEPK
jgi:hypothetical protein